MALKPSVFLLEQKWNKTNELHGLRVITVWGLMRLAPGKPGCSGGAAQDLSIFATQTVRPTCAKFSTALANPAVSCTVVRSNPVKCKSQAFHCKDTLWYVKQL